MIRRYLVGCRGVPCTFRALVLPMLIALMSGCGLLSEVPVGIDSYPTDFARFLDQQGLHREYSDLVYYLASNGLDNTVPVWQLLQQGSDWRRHQLPRFAIPPRSRWQEMLNTLVFIKYEVLPYIGPVKVLSGFRTPQYNLVAGGAAQSRHLTFSALDLRPVNRIERSELHAILLQRWQHYGPTYNLGLGLYGGLRFHIDTGGYRKW